MPLTEDHEQLDPLLRRARELAARERVDPELAAVLREVADPWRATSPTRSATSSR